MPSFARRLQLPPQEGDKLIRQLVRHVQPPTGGAQAQPFTDNARFAADKFPVAGGVLLHLGQGIYAPPAGIAAGVCISKAVQLS